MFLKKLEIIKDEISIRTIDFKKGINLIIDETDSNNRTSTGNGVGKTTVLRLVDFCLDGSGENIYIDPEFRTHNVLVENFLKENNIIIKLTLVENFDNLYSPKIIIEKNFLRYKEKIQMINGEQLSKGEFSKKLKELIFKTDVNQPTFKQLKAKNIRDEKHKLLNTIRVLAPNVVTDAVYETLYLFWFGIDADMSKDKLTREMSFEKKMQSRLRKDSNLSQINQSLIIINKHIEALENEKINFNVNKNYQNDLDSLNDLRGALNVLTTEISRLALRYELIIESKNELEKDVANIDTDLIKHVYMQAKSLIPNLQKTFEDVVNFHNGMLQKKIQFIIEELPSIEQELNTKKVQLGLFVDREKELVEKINNTGLLEDLQKIISDLNNYYERKGVLEEQKRSWKESNRKLKQIEDDLVTINNELSSKDDLIQKRITEFNAYFSDISNRLDGVHSLLSADNSSGMYKFEIANVENNPGTGTKKSQMASFDLAYIKYADTLGIPCLHFILQDQIENVHSNQITNLFTEIVNEVNCQYILPILRDKLPVGLDIPKYEVLILSQTDKIFRI
jgi:uncharacterized protein YydD (DUF2326 family)